MSSPCPHHLEGCPAVYGPGLGRWCAACLRDRIDALEVELARARGRMRTAFKLLGRAEMAAEKKDALRPSVEAGNGD